MNRRKFFAALWRVNAVIICVLGALGCTAVTLVLVLLYKETSRERQVQDVLNVVGEGLNHAQASLSDFKSINGSTVLRASLEVKQEYSLASSSKSSYATQNYLFFDTANDSSYWLLPGFKGIIPTMTCLPEREQWSDSKVPVKAVVYELIERDSNKDGQITSADLKDIAISDPAGAHLTRVLENVDSFHSVHLLSNGTEAVVLYSAGGLPQAAHIDIATGKVLRNVQMKPPKSASE